MKIFLDFDDVLFYTAAFVREKQDIFSKYGVPDILYRSTYDKAKLENGTFVKVYDLENHLQILKQENPDMRIDDIRNDMEQFLSSRSKEFVFPDTIDFLEKMRVNDIDMFLVSLGQPNFQRDKVLYAGLEKYFSRMFFGMGMKSDMIRDVMESIDQNEMVWFADDRVKFLEDIKREYHHIRTVQVMRREARWHDNKSESADFFVENMDELRSLLLSEYKKAPKL